MYNGPIWAMVWNVARSDVRWNGVPEHLRHPIYVYVIAGIKPSLFLQAIIANDLKMAVRLADTESFDSLRAIIKFFSEEVPCGAIGGLNALNAWVSMGGHLGV